MAEGNEQTPLLGNSKPSQPSTPTTVPQQPPKPTDDGSGDILKKFRQAVGINSVDDVNVDLEAARKSARGIYKEIIDTQMKRSRLFIFFEIIFYLALGTQIVVGGALTALGPVSAGHSQAITFLGIVNTSIAGILALFKGQGLPDRLRKDGYEMRKVQDFIEETESRLVVGGEGTIETEELDEILQQIFAKYNAARDTSEMNRPDSKSSQCVFLYGLVSLTCGSRMLLEEDILTVGQSLAII